MDRYAEKSGRDLSEMHWYLVFGYFRLGVALQQIYARWYGGQTKDERFASFGEKVRTLLLRASEQAASGKP
jgi:aminoglycoside phosphotransferase (APT) family kinase protein